MDRGSGDCVLDVPERTPSHGPLLVNDGGLLFPAVRGGRSVVRAGLRTAQLAGHSPDRDSPQPRLPGKAGQDGRASQGLVSEPKLAVRCPLVVGTCPQGSRRAQTVGLHTGRVAERFHPRSDCGRHRKVQAGPIHGPPHWGILGQAQQHPLVAGRAAEGQMEDSLECQEVRETRADSGRIRQDECRPSQDVREGGGRIGGIGRQALSVSKRLNVGSSRYRLFFLNLCSGLEGLTHCLRNQKYLCLSFDCSMGPAGDLSLPATRRRVKSMLKSGNCLGVVASPPGDTDDIGFTAFLADLFRLASLLQVPWLLETPLHCSLANSPLLRRLAEEDGVYRFETDMCGFGAAWKLRSAILCFSLTDVEDLRRVCVPHRNGRCGFTFRQHWPLRDSLGNTFQHAARACRWPTLFTRAVCVVLVNTAFGLEFNRQVRGYLTQK